MEDVMIRIAVLWIFTAVAAVVHNVMPFFEPDVLTEMLSEEMTLATRRVNVRLATVEAFANWLIPLTMAFLSVTSEGLARATLHPTRLRLLTRNRNLPTNLNMHGRPF